MNKKLLALYGLKWNPFAPSLPLEGLLVTPRIESFCFRVENSLVREGGFGQVEGEPGTGKSVTLRVLADRLSQLRDVKVEPLTHPTSGLADFYRELGDLFEIEDLKPHNRWCGFKALRSRWQTHINRTLVRPVLLCDEAQEMYPEVLRELRLLTSAEYDSHNLLTVVLAGDHRLAELLRRADLAPLASRIRSRLTLDGATSDDLRACLEHTVKAAGAPGLLTPELAQALVQHALGNYRTLMTLAGELLVAAAEREATQLDEQLFFDVFQPPASSHAKTTKPRPRRRR